MISESRSYYKRFYRLACFAIAVMTAVLTGSLVLGDSVRGSLTDRVDERIGAAETIIQTGTGYLSDKIMDNALLSSAKGYLFVEGFVAANGRMIPVNAWGCDDDSLKTNEALLNEELERETGLGTLVLHLPSHSLAPASSPFISQNYTTQMRLRPKGVKEGHRGGNILLHNEQMRPLNIFVNRHQLAQAMGVGTNGHAPVNVILSPYRFDAAEFKKIWRPGQSGISLNGNVVSSSSVFIPQNVADSLQPDERYLAYFVNSIDSIPYSFVTATDRLKGDEAILSDYSARQLAAGIGDSITMEYYVVKGLKRLETRSHRFTVSRIIPIHQMADNILTAQFPGLSNVESCTDWDSDLPIDMSRITKADEDYWAKHRQTPKAIVSLDAVGSDWEGEYGVATKIVADPKKMAKLTPEALGIAVVQPRDKALKAAQNGTDFSSLFLALGFFIILAAILLMQNPLMEMYIMREKEFRMYDTMGFNRRGIFRRLIAEALPTVLAAVPVGIALGYAYAATILWLMAGAWRGTTHTDGFTLHYSLSTIAAGFLVALAGSFALLLYAIWRGLAYNKKTKVRKQRGKWLAHVLAIATLTLITLNFTVCHSMAVFVVCGLLWIICGGIIGQDIIGKQAISHQEPSPVASHLKYYRRQNLLAFWTLTAGVFTVFSVGLNRPDADHFSTHSTGGYKLFAESHVPLQYDLNDPAARRHLSLDQLQNGTKFLQLAKHTQDEASCWNLNQVSTPTVLGIEKEKMADFGIDTTLFSNNGIPAVAIDSEALLWGMMKKPGDTIAYTANDGREVKVAIAASYPTGVFHGNALMPMEQFRSLWPDETGSKVLLVKNESEKGNISKSSTETEDLLSDALSDYGLYISTTTDRLRRFFEVTDAYLSIFMSLGGIGLLLGLASLLIVIRKNMAARSSEIKLYNTLGFSTDDIIRRLRREQAIVPLYAILVGTTGSIVSISANVRAVPLSIWLMATTLLLVLIITTRIIIQISINPKILKQ